MLGGRRGKREEEGGRERGEERKGAALKQFFKKKA